MFRGLGRYQNGGRFGRVFYSVIFLALGLAICLWPQSARAKTFTTLTPDGSTTNGTVSAGGENYYKFSTTPWGYFWIDLQPVSADLDLYGHWDTSVGRAKTGTDGIVGHGNHRYSDHYKAQAIDEHIDFQCDGQTPTYYIAVYGYDGGSYTIRIWSSNPPAVAVTYPTSGGVTWTPGQTKNITWTSNYPFHKYDVKIVGDSGEASIQTGLPGNTTSLSWTVAGTPSTNYKIKVIGYRLMPPPPVLHPENQIPIWTQTDLSDNAFAIVSGVSTVVNGRVVDQNGNGLSGLPIKFYLNGIYQSSPSATTDSSGSFFATLTQSGTWSFAAVYQGMDKTGNSKYITVGSQPTVAFDTLTIQTVANSTKVYGYVRDSKNGTPLSGSLVELRYQGSTVKGSATTSTSGYYQIDGKADVTGQYDCKATYNSKVGNSSLFNVSSGSASVQADVDIDTTSQTYSISGTITNASNGAAISSALVQLSGTGLSTYSDGTGHYTVGGVPGNKSYTLAVTKSGFTPKNVSTGTVSGNLAIDVPLQPDQATYDLVPQSVTPSKTSYASGETMDVSVRVSNGGLANGGAFTIGVYASTNTNGSISGDIPLGDISVDSSGIAVGQMRSFSRTSSLTGLVQAQPYYIKVFVDKNGNWPQEVASNNILASSTQIVVQPPPTPQQYTMGRLKINGVFTNIDSNTFTVAPGGTVNDWVQLPKIATVHKDTQKIGWNNGLILKPSPLPGMTGDSWQVLNLPAVTISADTGNVDEVLTAQNPLSFLTPSFPMQANFLTLNPYAQGGFQASYGVLFPLSRSAIQTLLANPGVIATLPFGGKPKGWLRLDAAGGFDNNGIQLNVQATGKIRVDGCPLVFQDIGGGINTSTKTLNFSGQVTFPILSGLWINISSFKTKNYGYPDSFDVSVEKDLPIWPFPGIPGAYIFGLDKLMVSATSLSDTANQDYAWGFGAGVMVGYAKINVPKVGKASLKALHLEAKGTYWPNKDEFEIKGNAKVFIVDSPVFAFDGIDLSDARVHYFRNTQRVEADGHFNYYGFLELGVDKFVYDLNSNALTDFHGTGVLQVPKVEVDLGLCKVKIWDGFELGDAEAWGISNSQGAWVWGIARAKVAREKGLGFHYTAGGSLDVSTDLFKQYGGKSSGAKSPEMVLVPAGQKFAVIRVSYPTGTASVSLTAPTVPTPTTYDSVNAAITEAYNGPVFYRANDQVEEDGQLRNEVCFYLNPVEGQHEVLPGQYTVNIQNPSEIGTYEVQLWLSNEAPAIVVTEPSAPVIVDPQAPQPVHIAFSGSDPDDDNVQIYLYYDTDQKGHDGQLINFESNSENVGPLPLPKAATGYDWNTAGVPTGDYYVYAMITDGKNLPVFSNYASGKVSIVHPEAPLPPSNLAATVVANSIACTWMASPTTGTQYLLLYDDLPMDSTERYQSAMGAEDLTTWAIPNLTYGRTYRVALVAVNPDTLDRSAIVGPVSVPLFSTTANNAPKIVSEPITEGRVGIPYSYQVEATDADGDALTFALLPHTVDGHPELASPPPGVTIDASTGLIVFTPVDGHLGTNKIIVQVSDSEGGTDSQEFYINIDNWLSSNSAPSFTSTPPTVAYVDEAFSYQAVAEDPDMDQVIYSLQNAPTGMTIGTTSGLIEWHPGTTDHGEYPSIVIQASDGKGETTTQALPLSVQYHALTAVFTVNPDTPQICPVEFVFTANPNTPYVTDYAWDFGDGTIVNGLDKQVVRHVFSDYALADFPADKTYNVTLTLTGPGNPDPQMVVIGPISVTVHAPLPVADFTASAWSGASPLSVTLTANAQWGFDEPGGGYAWDLDNDGQFDDAATEVVPNTFEAPFGQYFPVGLRVSGPSGTVDRYKTIIVQPAAGTTHEVINHPESSSPYWPDWRKAVPADIDGETLASSFDLSATPSALTLSTDEIGHAIAVSNTYQLNSGGFDFSFRTDIASGGCETRFGGRKIIEANFDQAIAVSAGDIDADGDTDIMGCSSTDNTVAWWENIDAKAEIWIKHIVDNNATAPHAVCCADIDQDGDLDVVGAAAEDDAVLWWENQEGDVSGWKDNWIKHVVSGDFDGAYSVSTADIDRDGDMDIVAGAMYASEIAWWKNTKGEAGDWQDHWTKTTVASSFRFLRTVATADIDGDGSVDILGAAVDDSQIAWWRNTGNGLTWTKTIIKSGFNAAGWVDAIDVDHDGDLDVVGTAQQGNSVAWFENLDGGGQNWNTSPLSDSPQGPTCVVAGDINEDGYPDIAAAGCGSGKVIWWKAVDGSAESFEADVVDPSFDGAVAVALIDIDGDSDLDILGAGQFANQIAWWENLSCHGDAMFTEETVLDYDFDGAFESSAVDLDQDGDMDIVAVGAVVGQVVWWENTDSEGSNWNKRLIGALNGADCLHVADLDGDGDLDIATGASGTLDELYWWKNVDAASNLWTRYTVGSASGGISEIVSGDLDGDGDLDIAAANGTGFVKWWLNTDGSGQFTEAPGISAHADRGVDIADIDRDGDLDILAASEVFSQVSWWENDNGDGSSWTGHDVDISFSAAQSARAADIDGDGDLDILGASEGDDVVAWWENLNGDGSAWSISKRVIGSGFGGALFVQAGDLDRDGDLDVCGAAFSGDEIAWWENADGLGGVWNKTAVEGGVTGASSVALADVDRDGDIDIVGTSDHAGQIAWWRNDLGDTGASVNGALRWMEVSESGIPPEAEEWMIYDSTREVSMLCRGTETWLWDGHRWMKHETDTYPPSQACMAFDSLRGKAVSFSSTGETWEWDGADWAQVATSGPPGRAITQMAFDSTRGKTVLFSGYNPYGIMWTDTWEWDGSSWTQVASGPPARYAAGMVYDSVRERVVLYGGHDNGQFFDDTWEWDGVQWTEVAAGPPARYFHTMAYDSGRQVCVIFGGTDLSSNPDGPMFDDTWEYDGNGWTRTNAIGTPTGRWRHMMTYDSSREEIVLFGGVSAWHDGVLLGDTWVLGERTAARSASAYVCFSPSDYLVFSANASDATLERIVVSEGVRTVIGLDTGSLSESWGQNLISLRYNGIDTFEVFEENVSTGIAISGVPGSTSLMLGLGFNNEEAEEHTAFFLAASLTLPNNPPTMTDPLPPVTVLSGEFDNSTDLDDVADDDLTPDNDLEFTVSNGTYVDASVDPDTHILVISALSGIMSQVTEMLQVVVTDGGGLSAQASIQVTVDPVAVSVEFFTNITAPANVGQIASSSSGASMAFLSGGQFADLCATRFASTSLYVNQGGNVYTTNDGPTPFGNYSAAAFGDYNNDGNGDVFLVTGSGGRLYQGDGLGGFTDVTSWPLDAASGKYCTWADVDNDGALDLYVVRDGGNALYLNDVGAGVFTQATVSGLEDMGNGETGVFADVDLDGDVDCYVGNLGGTNALYLNNGSGAFTLAPGSGTELTGDSHGAVFADFNNDGHPDLHVARDGGNVLLMNNGNGTFTDITVAAGITNVALNRSVTALDYDNDGYLDIFVSNNGSPNVLYHNNGNGTFTDVTAQGGVAGPTDGAGMGAAVGDIDNDGDVDIWQVNTNSQPAALFRNDLIGPLDDPQLTPNHHWLGVRLTGAASVSSTPHSFTNPSAIGARVELWKNGRLWQARTVDGGPNIPALHFGLGADTLAEQIVVWWPSGNVSRVPMIVANQILNITEDRVLDGIFLSPGRLSLTVGQAQGCTATAHYANGVTETLNASDLFWSVEHEAVAHVDALGMVVGVRNGTTQITARLNDVVSLPVEIEVADAPLATVVVAPAQARLVVGDSQPYIATAEYWNGTSVDVTNAAIWQSDNPGVVSLSSSGVATAHAAGMAHVSAIYRDVVSSPVMLEVVAGITTALELDTRESRFYKESNARENPFAALKTYSDGSPATDVSNQVRWIVDNPFVAWINNDGQFVTNRPGQANMQASLGPLQSNVLSVDVADHLAFITPLPDTVERSVNQSVNFSVQVGGGFEPLTYQWYKEDGTKVLIPVGTNLPTFSIQDLSVSDAGTYQIQVMDSNTDVQVNTTSLLVRQAVPVAGLVGVVVLLGLVTIGGVRTMRKK